MNDLVLGVSALVAIYSTIIVIALAIRAAIIAGREDRKSGEYASAHAIGLRRSMRKPFYHLLFRRHSHPTQPLV